MNFQPFKNLTSLKKLSMSYCNFHSNCFESFYINNFPNLNELELFNNRITNRQKDFNKNENETISIVNKDLKFPPILKLSLSNDGFHENLETLIIHTLIQYKTI